MKYPIGTKFMRKFPKRGLVECEVVDYYTTTNHAGLIVKQRYVVEYQGHLCQRMIDNDITQTTIDIALAPTHKR